MRRMTETSVLFLKRRFMASFYIQQNESSWNHSKSLDETRRALEAYEKACAGIFPITGGR